MVFLITIDTEADNQWARPYGQATQNTLYIPRFQRLCERYGFKPTYLCSYEMVQSAEFRDTVGPYAEGGRAEIGAHLHSWSTPPFEAEEVDPARFQAFASELSDGLFERKMATLTEAIRGSMRCRPRSYRAGRYGFHAPHVRILERLGYTVDCSVVPYTSYAAMPGLPGGKGGPDFRRARPGCYFLSYDDVTRPGESRLLEVPVTVLFPGWPTRRLPGLQAAWANNPGAAWARVLGRLGQAAVWMRPFRHKTPEQLVAVHQAATNLGLPCSEMILHSSELMPGGSPVFPDKASIEGLYRTLEVAFEAIAATGARGCTLAEFADQFAAEKAGAALCTAGTLESAGARHS